MVAIHHADLRSAFGEQEACGLEDQAAPLGRRRVPADIGGSGAIVSQDTCV
jgi:hypothetical protein